MKLALTGGSGIVGSAILDMAVARGDEVVVLDRVPSPAPRKNVRWIVATTDDYDAVFDAFAGCDVVAVLSSVLDRMGVA